MEAFLVALLLVAGVAMLIRPRSPLPTPEVIIVHQAAPRPTGCLPLVVLLLILLIGMVALAR